MDRRLFIAALATPLLARAFNRLDGKTVPNPLHLVFEGDSLTTGSGQEPAGCWVDNTCPGSWPNQLLLNLSSIDLTVHQFASDAATMRDVIVPRQPALLATYDQARTNVLFLAGGSNDLHVLEMYGRQLYNRYYAPYVQAATAAGFIVIPTTLPARMKPTTPPNFEQERQSFNGLLRANHPRLLVDLDNDPRLGAFGASASTLYFQDGAHPTAAGAAIWCDLALVQLIGA